jgi:hypothetical protein
MAGSYEEDGNVPTDQEFRAWIAPREALNRRGALEPQAAVDALLVRLKSGMLPAVAAIAKWTHEGEKRDDERVPFPEEWWGKVSAEHAYDLFWTAASADLTVQDRDGRGLPIYFIDVRLEPDAVLALLDPEELRRRRQPSGAPETPPAGPSSPRGRPKWPHWEDFWADVAARFSRGGLEGVPQARIEDAMAEVAAEYPNPPEVSAIRIRAQKLVKALKKHVTK